jgi:hypothetical protein
MSREFNHPESRLEWRRLEGDMNVSRFYDYDEGSEEDSGENPVIAHTWGVPLERMNPDVIFTFIGMNKRIEELEDKVKELEGRLKT